MNKKRPSGSPLPSLSQSRVCWQPWNDVTSFPLPQLPLCFIAGWPWRLISRKNHYTTEAADPKKTTPEGPCATEPRKMGNQIPALNSLQCPSLPNAGKYSTCCSSARRARTVLQSPAHNGSFSERGAAHFTGINIPGGI